MSRAAATRRGQVRIGISGWRGSFYPEKTAPARRARLRRPEIRHDRDQRHALLEINGTHYSLQRPEFFAHWRDETPDGFVFAVKGSRFITHLKQLREIETPLANFFAQGVLHLGQKLGPILWQFPPRFRFDEARLDAFFTLLPRDTEAAALLAERHDHRLAGRAWTKTEKNRPLRHAVEIRHPSFLDPAFVRLLRRHRLALVFADTVDWPYAEDLTAGFLYLRLHGSEELYASGYGDEALDWWAARIATWCAGSEPSDAKLIDSEPRPHHEPRDVYAYFDNDAKVRAPFDAQTLRHKLGRM